MDKSAVDLGDGAPEYSGDTPIPLNNLESPTESFLFREMLTPGYESEFVIDPSADTEDLETFKRFDPYQNFPEPLVDTSNPLVALYLFKALARRRRGPEIAMEDGGAVGEVYRGYLPGESSVEDIPILGPVVSALAPVEREVITPPETIYAEDMGRRYVDKVIPGEYGEPRLGTPAAIQGILDFVGFLKEDPGGAASAVGEGIAEGGNRGTRA